MSQGSHNKPSTMKTTRLCHAFFFTSRLQSDSSSVNNLLKRKNMAFYCLDIHGIKTPIYAYSRKLAATFTHRFDTCCWSCRQVSSEVTLAGLLLSLPLLRISCRKQKVQFIDNQSWNRSWPKITYLAVHHCWLHILLSPHAWLYGKNICT